MLMSSLVRVDVVMVALLAACTGSTMTKESTGQAVSESPYVQRNVIELELVKDRAPASDADCPTGSHCDEVKVRCDWSCLSDSDCGDSGGICTALGGCEARSAAMGVVTNVDNDSDP